jgi:mannosyltransferase OCH1-like enzyme
MPSRADITDGPEHHRQRSEFIRGLVQRSATKVPINDRYKEGPPKTIVQFWHDLGELPADIKECIASWARWTASGFAHFLFDEDGAREFIGNSLDARHERAFRRCYHPAMQADYFRLCYLFVEGGFYVDADDVCVSAQTGSLFEDGRLKVQPLCYDITSAAMVNTTSFLRIGAYEASWIFYVNNNPLIASKGHPIIERALQRATDLLEFSDESALPEIQATTGPGNLSRSIFEHGAESEEADRELVVLRDWESFAVSRWPLSHRIDARNWRLSNQQRFRRNEN